MIKDILLKAAEDVTQGLWCQGFWFTDPDRPLHPDYQFLPEDVFTSLARGGQELIDRSHWLRCAEGSIALATALLGGGESDYDRAIAAVQSQLGDHDNKMDQKPCTSLWEHNDECLPNDRFEAGHQLSELFRKTAEAL